MIPLSNYRISDESATMLLNVDFDVFVSATAPITIQDQAYGLELKQEQATPAWQPPLIGYWQDFVLRQVDDACGRMLRGGLEAIQQTITFNFGNIQRTLTAAVWLDRPQQLQHDDDVTPSDVIQPPVDVTPPADVIPAPAPLDPNHNRNRIRGR